MRPGNAGSNTAADHLTLLERALMQIPDRWRSHPVLVRADGAGFSHALINGLSAQGLEFSVGYPVTEAVRTAIGKMPWWAWQVACNADGDLREHADWTRRCVRSWTIPCCGNGWASRANRGSLSYTASRTSTAKSSS